MAYILWMLHILLELDNIQNEAFMITLRASQSSPVIDLQLDASTEPLHIIRLLLTKRLMYKIMPNLNQPAYFTKQLL